jgi:hypothetical protein
MLLRQLDNLNLGEPRGRVFRQSRERKDDCMRARAKGGDISPWICGLSGPFPRSFSRKPVVAGSLARYVHRSEEASMLGRGGFGTFVGGLRHRQAVLLAVGLEILLETAAELWAEAVELLRLGRMRKHQGTRLQGIERFLVPGPGQHDRGAARQTTHVGAALEPFSTASSYHSWIHRT